MEDNSDRRLLQIEFLGSLAWFLMDAMWMCEFSTAAHLLAVPTVSLAIALLYFVPRNIASIASTGAAVFWLLMNVCWMAHDLGTMDSGLVFAKVFFACGGLAMVVAFCVAGVHRDGVLEVFRRFRRRPPTNRQ